MKKENIWDDLTEETINHKYAGDYITISKFGRFSMKAQTIFKHKEFKIATHVDIRYSRGQKALVFLFNNEEKGLKFTYHKQNPKIVVFASMYFFARLELNELTIKTKKYVCVKEKIPILGHALVIYIEKNTSKKIEE